MVSRRELLLAAAAVAVLPGRASASSAADAGINPGSISWSEFQSQMAALAVAASKANVKQETLVERGKVYLRRLDINSLEFKAAVASSYETGNRYWLWQRMIKQQNINGGVLTIDRDQAVQLHDHPGATGLLRIISGEAEVWQFDQVKQDKENKSQQVVELLRVSHRVLRPGDTAVLTPQKGNIHALRATAKECRMLDFFIPPYHKSQRNWFEPLAESWFDKERVSCRKIPQQVYTKA